MQNNSNRKVVISIIIVHYLVSEKLFECLKSIKQSKPGVSYEVIVVDNDDSAYIKSEIKKRFKWVKYIKPEKNIGFGAGNNVGAKFAIGEFLFFLNPDSLVFKKTIDNLVSFLRSNRQAAGVSPLLINPKKKVYPLQGTLELTPLRGSVALSFLNNIFPNNQISKEYWMHGWDKSKLKEADVLPGTAFVIRRKIFRKVNGFDEQFFLYFEEFDLWNRVKKLGFKLYITPHAKLIHYWGESTKKKKDKDEIFRKSRYLYFKKNYGFFSSIVVHLITSIGKNALLLLFILGIATYMRFAYLEENMNFLGDFGWFYISARDMLLNGNIPLVGITSSRTWLHQGPLWTYMLSAVFFLFDFNPVNGGYLASTIGVLTVIVLYFVISSVFNKRVALLSTLLFSVSPLAVYHSRLPYHTTPIPFFTILLFYSVYKFTSGNSYFFPISIFILCILYQLELATVIFVFMFLLIFLYGFWKKAKWVKNIFNKKVLIFSILAFIIPMFPILIYDFSHSFSQTVIFALWIPYKFLKFTFNIFSGSGNLQGSFSMIQFYADLYQRLIFAPSFLFSLFLLCVSMINFLLDFAKQIKSSNPKKEYVILLLFIIFSIAGIFISQTPSEAYFPPLFMIFILLLGLLFDKLFASKRLIFASLILVIIVTIGNIKYLHSNKYTMPGITLAERIVASKEIIKLSNNSSYQLSGSGPGSEHRSFTMNYEYLTWWIGHGPSEISDLPTIIISESAKGISLKKQNN